MVETSVHINSPLSEQIPKEPMPVNPQAENSSYERIIDSEEIKINDLRNKAKEIVGQKTDTGLVLRRNEKVLRYAFGTSMEIIRRLKSGDDQFDDEKIQCDTLEKDNDSFRRVTPIIKARRMRSIDNTPFNKLVEEFIDEYYNGEILNMRQSQNALVLSERETEILSLLGFESKEIASRLFISQRTAETHVSNILSKLRVNTRSGAVIQGLYKGLINLSDLENEYSFSTRHSPEPKPLTARESEIIHLLINIPGLTSKEYAQIMGYSNRTYDSQMAHVLAKLGVNKASLIAPQIFFRNGTMWNNFVQGPAPLLKTHDNLLRLNEERFHSHGISSVSETSEFTQ